MVAQAVGTATLYVADSAGRGDSITVTVVSEGYTTVFLGDDVGNDSRVVALNDSADVVLGEGIRAFLWRNQAITDLGTCRPAGINNGGQIACNNGPAIWHDGKVTPIDLADFSNPQLTSINDSGDVAGYSFSGVFVRRRDGTIERRGPDLFTGGAAGMNGRGDVVGYLGVLYVSAVVFTNDGVRGLGSGGRYGKALDINDSMHAVGFSENPSGSNLTRPQLWRYESDVWTRVQLGRAFGFTGIPNGLTGTARALNARTEVVGVHRSPIPPIEERGFLWRDGCLTALSDVLEDPDWEITDAIDINVRGHVVGQGRNSRTGQSGAVLLTPRAVAGASSQPEDNWCRSDGHVRLGFGFLK